MPEREGGPARRELEGHDQVGLLKTGAKCRIEPRPHGTRPVLGVIGQPPRLAVKPSEVGRSLSENALALVARSQG